MSPHKAFTCAIHDGEAFNSGGEIKDQNANTFFMVQNATNGLSANAVVRTQADVAVQNFQSHASSRTIVRWGTPLGRWNEFLSVTGTGLAMGTLGNAPFVLGTSSTARVTLDGDSNVIDFAGGGQYNGANFLDASSRRGSRTSGRWIPRRRKRPWRGWRR